MFGKKYIFETKSTRLRRITLNSSLASVVFLALYLMLCLFLPFFAQSANESSNNLFYKKSPDFIAVFTGDSGRISHAIEKSKESEHIQVLISGVYAANTLRSLFTENELEELTSRQIDIDYLARNTQENVIYTLRHLRDKKGVKDVLIISSDYHLFRIQLLLEKIKRDDDPYKFHLQGTQTDYTQWRNIKVLFKEGVKVIKTFLFLIFWD